MLNFIRNVLRRLAQASQSWRARYLIKPLLISLPAGAVSALLGIDRIHDEMQKAFPAWVLWMDAYPSAILLSTAVWGYFVTAIFGILEKISERLEEFEASDLLSFVKVLERIVEAKANRFSGTLMRIEREAALAAPVAGDVFKEITQPGQQIASIVEGIKAYVETLSPSNINVKVGLAPVEDNLPGEEWFCFAPRFPGPRTPLSVLRHPESAIRNCINKKDIVIIEDVQRELKKRAGRRFFLPERDAEYSERSLLCYPIFKDNRVVLVISISVDENKFFDKRKKKIYALYLNQFALRISLEYCLYGLREKVA